MMRLAVFGVFLLALSGSRGDEVRQWPTSLALNVRGSAEVNCVQEGTLRDNMLWYRQSANGSFTLIGYTDLAGKAHYEEGFKSGFPITRTMENKKSTLKIDSVKLTDSAIYFCAASTSLHSHRRGIWGEESHLRISNSQLNTEKTCAVSTATIRNTFFTIIDPYVIVVKWQQIALIRIDHCAGSIVYFGEGTKLTVLEYDVKDPVITIYGPSPEELKVKKKATIVCLVTAFYPDNIKILWFLDNAELLPTDVRVQTDHNSMLEDGNKSYSISSRIRLSVKDWVRYENFECKVDHYQQGTEKKTKTAALPIKAEICGTSKEDKIHSMDAGKLTYLILTCKSVFYGIFISIIAWKTKTSYSKRFD
ncbi:uncharacterized protein LOC125447665 [Stegostoma tigrinum]|uniref:uncharacterized protein LOC125447665 n=1 Tax=Stegostoma tigrinum TaxID=3053191 RepID=UPI002870B20A|nr:uncharacterized protein LOC125447665 [Stegostoma tigrinum]